MKRRRTVVTRTIEAPSSSACVSTQPRFMAGRGGLRRGACLLPQTPTVFDVRNRLCELTLWLLVCLAPWAFGSVEAWAELGLYALIGLLTILVPGDARWLAYARALGPAAGYGPDGVDDTRRLSGDAAVARYVKLDRADFGRASG